MPNPTSLTMQEDEVDAPEDYLEFVDRNNNRVDAEKKVARSVPKLPVPPDRVKQIKAAMDKHYDRRADDEDMASKIAKILDDAVAAAKAKTTVDPGTMTATPATPNTGLRYDDGKPRFDLIPPEAVIALAAHYERGARKYADRNWEKGMAWGKCFASMQRHAWAWSNGEDIDAETDTHHMIAVAWNALALYTYAMRKIGTDDRAVKNAG